MAVMIPMRDCFKYTGSLIWHRAPTRCSGVAAGPAEGEHHGGLEWGEGLRREPESLLQQPRDLPEPCNGALETAPAWKAWGGHYIGFYCMCAEHHARADKLGIATAGEAMGLLRPDTHHILLYFRH